MKDRYRSAHWSNFRKHFQAPHRLLLALSILLIFFIRCVASSGGGSGPPESLMMPFTFEGGNLAWNVGHEAGNAVLRVVELVRPGETVDNWTELVTVQTFNKAVDVGTVESQVASFQRDLAARCSGATLEAIPEHSTDRLYESNVINCKSGDDEHNLTRIIDGRANRFIVQYAVRRTKTMTPERRAEWIGKLSAVQIVESR
jgi:hypothetical protein